MRDMSVRDVSVRYVSVRDKLGYQEEGLQGSCLDLSLIL